MLQTGARAIVLGLVHLNPDAICCITSGNAVRRATQSKQSLDEGEAACR
jgi:hypothetical protein